MTQISILKGVYVNTVANWGTSYPINLEPVVTDTGLSKGYLRTAPGLVPIAEFTAVDRGAIWWRGVCYRVMSSAFVTVIGSTVTQFGTITTGTSPVSLDYSFDLLCCVTEGDAFLTDGVTVTQITDPDLGEVIDVVWLDGYFIYTDGEFIIVSDLADPFNINPLKYGSSEEDPDNVVGLRKVRGELYVLNRYTIQNFQNVGGAGFPFANNPGGLIPFGCVGTHASAYFMETFAFVGGARNEAPSVYLAGSGTAVRISTPQIDRYLADLTDFELERIEMESIVRQGDKQLFIHTNSRTLVYSANSSAVAGEPVWHILADGPNLDLPYRARHFALAGGRFIGGTNTGRIGYLSENIESVFGDTIAWQFDTTFLYNEGRGAIIKSLELVGAPGRVQGGLTPTCRMYLTFDGQEWSDPMTIPLGVSGDTLKRLQWRPKRKFENYCAIRFYGFNAGIQSFARLEADIEGLG